MGGIDTGPSEAVRHGGGRRTKNLQGGRERKGRKGKKRERERERERGREREEKKKRKREGEQEGLCCGCKHLSPSNCYKIVKDTEKGGGRENPGKRLGVKDVRRDRNSRTILFNLSEKGLSSKS